MPMPHHSPRWQSQIAADLETLGAQQLDLVVDAAAVVADGPVGANDAMARHKDRNRIRRHRGADRALRIGLPNGSGKLVIRNNSAGRDFAQGHIRAALEIALDQAQVQRMRQRCEVALEHAIDLRLDAPRTRFVLDQVELLAQHREHPLGAVGPQKMYPRDAAVAFSDHQPPKLRRDHADPRLRPPDDLHRALDSRPRLSNHRVDRAVADRFVVSRCSSIAFHFDHSSSLSFFRACETLARALSAEQSSAAPISAYSNPANLRIINACPCLPGSRAIDRFNASAPSGLAPLTCAGARLAIASASALSLEMTRPRRIRSRARLRQRFDAIRKTHGRKPSADCRVG